MRKRILIGLLGSVLDDGRDARRWERWRPSVDICRHDDLVFERFELLRPSSMRSLGDVVAGDVGDVSPETTVVQHDIGWDDPWDFEGVFGALHDFARCYAFDLDRFEYLVHITTGTHVAQICLFLLTESRHFPGRLIQTSPPSKKSAGGPGGYRIIDLDLSRYDRLAARFADEHQSGIHFLKSGIDTRNIAFNATIEQIEQVALRSSGPIVITGPTGAGKSHLARKIHDLRRSRKLVDGPFVEVNCATLRGDAAMSMLFGHTKGAFTGAVQARAGLLRSADGGTLFLDEIGDLGADEQAMLLHAIEERRFLPVGADHEVQSDFHLVAGTHRDLQEDVRSGRFRDDLLARISLWTFRLPGLCDRREDIEPNLDFELESFARRTGQRVRFSKEARGAFLRFARSEDATWPNNFRDLNGAVTRMATLSAGGRITDEIVMQEIARMRQTWQRGSVESASPALALLGDATLASLDRFDRVQLDDVLSVCTGCRSLSEAGRRLFAVSRKRRSSTNDADRLRKYLTRFGISWSDVQSLRGRESA